MKNAVVIGLAAILSSSIAPSSHAQSLAADSVASFEKIFGVTEGKRRNHTKGFCFTATLVPQSPEIRAFSHSMLFTEASSVIGRLSHKGGNNTASDEKPGEYGMGLKITTAQGELHMMAMNTLDFFPVSTPEAFVELNFAKAAGKEAVAEFKKNHPSLSRYGAHMAKRSKELKPYEAMVFNSINSFYMENENGSKTAVRWAFRPQSNPEIVVDVGPDFFLDNLARNLTERHIAWDMIVTIANADDPVNDAAVLWEGDHVTIHAATLKLSGVMSEADGQCDEVNFDPLVLSAGFAPSEDPILHARRPSYAISFGKRLSEKNQ